MPMSTSMRWPMQRRASMRTPTTTPTEENANVLPMHRVARPSMLASLAVVCACACKRDASSSSVQPDPTPAASGSSTAKKTAATEHGDRGLSVPVPADLHFDAPGGWVQLITVTTDDVIHFGGGAFGNTSPETTMHLEKERVVNGTGAEIVACRGGSIVVEGTVRARFVPGGFDDDVKRVTIAPGGVATLAFHSSTETTRIRFDGLVDGDACTAALLYFVIPVPSAL
jgi:hypothetical protein